MQEPIGVTFEVRNNVRVLDGEPMPQPMPDGWYWSYDQPSAPSLCHGPFSDCIAAGLDMGKKLNGGETMSDQDDEMQIDRDFQVIGRDFQAKRKDNILTVQIDLERFATKMQVPVTDGSLATVALLSLVGQWTGDACRKQGNRDDVEDMTTRLTNLLRVSIKANFERRFQ